jgi:hypothetical protein
MTSRTLEHFVLVLSVATMASRRKMPMTTMRGTRKTKKMIENDEERGEDPAIREPDEWRTFDWSPVGSEKELRSRDTLGGLSLPAFASTNRRICPSIAAVSLLIDRREPMRCSRQNQLRLSSGRDSLRHEPRENVIIHADSRSLLFVFACGDLDRRAYGAGAVEATDTSGRLAHP